MSSPEDAPNNFFASKKGSAAELARTVAAYRPAKPTTARSRMAAAPKAAKRQRARPVGPTAERLAKGDINIRVGMHRAIPPIERLRDQARLAPNDTRENQALYEAALKLRRHYEGMGGSVQAQDLNKVIGGACGDLTKEEAWVHHRHAFRTAVKLIGWSDTNPHRGAGRIVAAVVCHEMTVGGAAAAHLPPGRAETRLATGMDRLREGLFALALHWRMV